MISQFDSSHMIQVISRFLSPLDIHFAKLMLKLSHTSSSDLFLASALVSRFTRDGHICLNLSNGFPVWDETEIGLEPFDMSNWRQSLIKFPVVGMPGDFKPLILDDAGRLYLYRYWEYEKKLADCLLERIKKPVNNDHVPEILTKFPSTVSPDWQKIAVYMALTHQFCAISGAPGTGKTTTIAKILAALLEQSPNTKIILAAPTGKAAARLKEAIHNQKDLFDKHLNRIPQETYTLHRLLGTIPYPPFFRYNETNKLIADTVIIDEASMADLPMISRLIQALPSTARLILIGDMDQLASVNPGAVFADICTAGDISAFSESFCNGCLKATGEHIVPTSTHVSAMSDCLIKLQTNYRFSATSGIHTISQAINSGKTDVIGELLSTNRFDDISWKDLPEPNALKEQLQNIVVNGFTPYLIESQIEDIFDRFRNFRILCANKAGPYGVVTLNRIVEKILSDKNLIFPQRTYYRGKPVIITQNDYHLNLFNGDMGIVLTDSDGDLKVFFMNVDGRIRKIHPARLPAHETAFAMTVHKSQGSEFDQILLILSDRYSPIFTRELIYTGITRARKQAIICGKKDIFYKAVSEKIQRSSGLKHALVSGIK